MEAMSACLISPCRIFTFICRFISFALFVFFSPAAQAFTFSSGQNTTCHSANGQPALEVTVPTLGGPFHTGYTGITMVAPNGSAQITWDGPKLTSLPAPVHDFIYFHECAHAHVPTSDELVANCVGLADMRAAGMATPAIEAQIGQFHASLGDMGPRYGIGTTYWNNTVQCADRMSSSGAQMQMSTSINSGSTTTTCRFNFGPLTGQVIDYHGRATPIPVGSPCTDGISSSGVAVPPSATVATSSFGLTKLCHFQTGAKAGQTIDYTSAPGIIAVGIGTSCTDGTGSFGVAVASSSPTATFSAAPVTTGMSAKCQFTIGPRSGQMQDFSPRPPIPVGTPCNDGQGSIGTVIP